MSPRKPIFLAATAATALHVLDDATLHREPGTTIADHLTGAGVLLAVLAVAALVIPGSVQASKPVSRSSSALSQPRDLKVRPAEYERRVVGFFDRYLLGARTS